jgi:hypothetical protein
LGAARAAYHAAAAINSVGEDAWLHARSSAAALVAAQEMLGAATTRTLDEFWASVPAPKPPLEAEWLAALPDAARRYLQHAIAPGAPLASAVRLRMHGEIKLRRWLPFLAEQVIRRDRGMIWSATIRMHGLPVRGFDRLLDGEGAMRWKLLGIIPLVTASGSDISRSAAGRLQAESVWLPSMLCGDDVTWTGPTPSHAYAQVTVRGHSATLDLAVNEVGRLQSVSLPRWGNPTSGEFRSVPFGGLVEEEGTFGGYTIPIHLGVGWYFGTDRFAGDGEFFRVKIDDAVYR